GSPCLDLWRSLGLWCAAEAFADRMYERNGTLRQRKFPGAVLQDPERAARQALDIAVRHRVSLDDGSELYLVAETLCIHSDTPGAATIARVVNERLKAAGVQLRAMSAAWSYALRRRLTTPNHTKESQRLLRCEKYFGGWNSIVTSC